MITNYFIQHLFCIYIGWLANVFLQVIFISPVNNISMIVSNMDLALTIHAKYAWNISSSQLSAHCFISYFNPPNCNLIIFCIYFTGKWHVGHNYNLLVKMSDTIWHWPCSAAWSARLFHCCLLQRKSRSVSNLEHLPEYWSKGRQTHVAITSLRLLIPSRHDGDSYSHHFQNVSFLTTFFPCQRVKLTFAIKE